MTNITKHIITYVFLLFSSTTIAATFSAQVNVNPVLLSDPFKLIYSAEGSVDDEPDFSPIRKDFQILSVGQSNSFTNASGSFTQTKKWILSLRAKKVGQFRIPPILFGNDQTPEVEINVKEVIASTTTSPTQDFIVELEASIKSAFIQEQVIITARLLIAQNINSYQFSELSLTDSDTIIESLGKDTQYKTYRGSKPYIIIEKKFAIFPQHTGKLSIKPLVAEIGIVRQNSRQNIFDPFNNNAITKRVQSKALNLNIKNIPSSFKSKDWLPTSSLKLVEDWPQSTKFYAGEPITRTLTIMADGLTSVQLPELVFENVANLKQYPDKPFTQDTKSDKGLSSIRKEKVALIPTHAGTYTLPAIDIPWWNTKTNKVDTAHLSSRTITVLASNIPAAPPVPLLQNSNVPKNSNQADQTKQQLKPSLISKDNQNSIWLWLSLLFLILWLTTLILWWKSKQTTPRVDINQQDVSQSLTTSLKYLKAACNKNNLNDTRMALIRWAQILFERDDINNLSDVAVLVTAPLSDKILSLNSSLYSMENNDFNASDIYELCRNYKVEESTTKEEGNSAKLEPFNYTD